jgi:phosphoribosylanthranilate isomerase
MRVKICGITNLEDAHAAIAAGADALGFILYEKSKRFIPIEAAIQIAEQLPPFVQTVAVTVNATKEFTNLGWRKQLKNFGVAQLHGEESPAHVKAVRKYLPVIKVLPADPHVLLSSGAFEIPAHMTQTINKLRGVRAELEKTSGREVTAEEIAEAISLPIERVRAVLRLAEQISSADRTQFPQYQSAVSAFMLDTPSESRGGTGQAFDWNLAVEFKKRITKSLILSGGLNPENVAKAIEKVQPYAVDVSSGVEASPGRKDHAKLRDFIQICKSL